MTRFTRRELDAINEALALWLAGEVGDGLSERDAERLRAAGEAAQRKVQARIEVQR